MVKTLKAYHMQKNLYERFVLTGSKTQKLQMQALASGCEGSHSCLLLVFTLTLMSQLVKSSVSYILLQALLLPFGTH